MSEPCCEVLVYGSDTTVAVVDETTEMLVLIEDSQIVVQDTDVEVMVLTDFDTIVINDAVGAQGPTHQVTLVARENIPAFAVVAIDSAGLAYLPDKDVLADAPRIAGVATTSALTGETFVVLLDGTLLQAGTWTMGPLYVGDNGVLTSTPPAALYQLQIGTAVTTSEVLIRPQIPIVLV